jgi:hypothetical protein
VFGVVRIIGNRQRNDKRAEEGRIVVSANVMLDGIGRDPPGEEGFKFGGWFQMTDGDREAWAQRLREMPKYVVRSTGGRSDWEPTTVLRGDPMDEAPKLKRTIAGDIPSTAATNSCARCWTTPSSTKYGWSSSRVWSGPVVASSAS